MVKKLLAFFTYALFFILALMYFTPKTSLYHTLEKELKKYDVVISDETIEDRGFSLNLENFSVYVKEVDSASVENVNVKFFALYNSISVQNVTLSSVAATFIPIKVDELSVTYSIFNPLNVTAEASGAFGEAKGAFNILERTLNLNVIPSEEMSKSYKNSMNKMKKNEDGSYGYDKTF